MDSRILKFGSFFNALPLLRNISKNCVYSSEVPLNNFTSNTTPKKKYSVTKLVYPSKTASPIIVEQKDAAEVMKNLNYEFMQLYGPVQNSKIDYSKKNLRRFNAVIRNRTSIPITNEYSNSSMLNEETETEQEQRSQNALSAVLKFPLTNMPILNKSHSELLSTKMNTLKEYLEKKSGSVYPSVSKILQKTMPEESVQNLKRWEEKMIMELGEEGFKIYKSGLFENGTLLHSNINDYLTDVPERELDIKSSIAGHWKSLKSVFPLINDVKLLEEKLSHPFLCYKGVVDCFAKYRDNLVVIDWKTSKKKKSSLSSTFDNPLQIAAYVGALNFDPKYQYMARNGLIVVAYEDGEPASAHFMNEITTHRYWREWLRRVKQYWEMVDAERQELSTTE